MDTTGDVGRATAELRSDIRRTSHELEQHIAQLRESLKNWTTDLKNPLRLKERVARSPFVWSSMAFGLGCLVGAARSGASARVLHGVGRASGGVLAGFGRTIGARLFDLALESVTGKVEKQ